MKAVVLAYAWLVVVNVLVWAGVTLLPLAVGWLVWWHFDYGIITGAFVWLVVCPSAQALWWALCTVVLGMPATWLIDP